MGKHLPEERSTSLQEKLDSLAAEIGNVNKDSDAARYQALKAKLAATAWQLFESEYGNKMADFAVEVMETLNQCLDSFAPEKGSFSHYLNRAFKTNKKCERRRRSTQDRQGGIKTNSRLEGILRTVERSGKKLSSPEIQEWIKNTYGIKSHTLQAALNAYLFPVQGEFTRTADGTEHSVLDTATSSATAPILAHQHDAEDSSPETLRKICEAIEAAFTSQQERTKSYIRALATREFLPMLVEQFGKTHPDIGKASSRKQLDEMAETYFSRYQFIDKQILHDYLTTDRLPKQQEIAKQFGRDKTDASRALKKFMEKVSTLL